MNQNKALAVLKDLSKGIDSTLLFIGAASTIHFNGDKLYVAKHKNLMWLSASYQGPQYPYLGMMRNTLQEDKTIDQLLEKNTKKPVKLVTLQSKKKPSGP